MKLVWITPNAEHVITYCGRVSNPANQDNVATEAKLLAYLIKHKHWSPFEMASMCLEINTSRAISRQILRHRSFSFQEFCIAGKSKITCGFQNAKGKWIPYYIPIERLFKRQKWKNYSDVRVRVYSEIETKFTWALIKEVFSTGKKECVKIIFEDGKEIISTIDHKYYTASGWQPLKEALGLEKIGSTWTQKTPVLLATNGLKAYESKEWLQNKKNESISNGQGLNYIAAEANCSTHTIRKWLRRFNLQYTKREVAAYTPIWNVGKTGYKVRGRTREQRTHMQNITPKGKEHHAYRGGSQSKRRAICNYFTTFRQDIYKKYSFKCQLCTEPLGSTKIELHHVKSVAQYPELSMDISNVRPVHKKCHMQFHGMEWKGVSRSGSIGNTLVPRFQRVVQIVDVGFVETYDLEVEHESHNYVANKVMVHNSQRYAEVAAEPIFVEARSQDTKNRQASHDNLSDEAKNDFKTDQKILWDLVKSTYDFHLHRGVAKECARTLLPEGMTPSTLYMSGTIRSWIHYFDVRCDESTQLEHRLVANEAKRLFIEVCPKLGNVLWQQEERGL